jgi:outer membrane lipoprotein LolB
MIPRPVTAALTALLLSACAGLGPVQRADAPDFDIVGRVVVSGEGRAFSSNLRWRHEAGRDELWLLTPLGQALAHIATDAAGATLTTPDQQEYRALSAASLTERALGWALPLAELRHWLQAQPVPAQPAAALQRDAGGRLERLEQGGWTLQLAYEDALRLPRRLDLERGGQRIRLVIDERRDPAAAEPLR